MPLGASAENAFLLGRPQEQPEPQRWRCSSSCRCPARPAPRVADVACFRPPSTLQFQRIQLQRKFLTGVHRRTTVIRGRSMSNPVQQPDEMVTIVDLDNNVVDQVTRQVMRAQNLIYRCTFTIVYNSKQEVLVQKRSSSKETYPSTYDPCPGGVVRYLPCLLLRPPHRLMPSRSIPNRCAIVRPKSGWCRRKL